MTENNQTLMMQTRLNMLIKEHRKLDTTITDMLKDSHTDMLQLQRYKRKKLRLKDEIQALKSMLTPDILA